MPKEKKVEKPVEVSEVNPNDYPDYGEYLAAKKAAQEKQDEG